MTKRFLFQFVFCVFISVANASKDVLPLCNHYLKSYVCSFQIKELLDTKSLSYLNPNITDKELNALEDIIADYCKSALNINQLKK